MRPPSMHPLTPTFKTMTPLYNNDEAGDEAGASGSHSSVG